MGPSVVSESPNLTNSKANSTSSSSTERKTSSM